MGLACWNTFPNNQVSQVSFLFPSLHIQYESAATFKQSKLYAWTIHLFSQSLSSSLYLSNLIRTLSSLVLLSASPLSSPVQHRSIRHAAHPRSLLMLSAFPRRTENQWATTKFTHLKTPQDLVKTQAFIQSLRHFFFLKLSAIVFFTFYVVLVQLYLRREYTKQKKDVLKVTMLPVAWCFTDE